MCHNSQSYTTTSYHANAHITISLMDIVSYAIFGMNCDVCVWRCLLCKSYEFVIGRPHSQLPTSHIQGYINKEEGVMAQTMVCTIHAKTYGANGYHFCILLSSKTCCCHFSPRAHYKPHPAHLMIRTRQWAEEKKYGDMAFIPMRVSVNATGTHGFGRWGRGCTFMYHSPCACLMRRRTLRSIFLPKLWRCLHNKAIHNKHMDAWIGKHAQTFANYLISCTASPRPQLM